jgi:uncharacterized protein YjaZ
MKILVTDSPYDVPADFLDRYKSEVKNAYEEAITLLPFGSPHTNFIVQPREFDLIDETNDNGRVYNSSLIELAFNPTLDAHALEEIIQNVRPTVFHEFNHAARFHKPILHATFLDGCILEGLANVFAREYTNEKAPWAEYPSEVTDWMNELIKVGEAADYEEYMYTHPDGRRWIGYRVGTYIVDTAIKLSGESILKLSSMECAEIVKLAGIEV